jgi:hypothetical protein
MKALIATLLLAASTLFAADGVFYVDKPTEAHLIAQNGATTTNQLAAGSTTVVGNTTLTELCPSEKTTFQLASGPIISADGGSIFSINAFDVDVKNLTNQPSPAVFGSHNLSITLTKGNFTIIYAGEENSTCAVASPLAMYQLNKGKFLFQISDQKSLVYVLDGMMTVHGDKNRTDAAKKGSKSITGQIDTEVATTTRPINPQESTTLAAMQGKDSASVLFIVIDGRVRGVRMP